jgi:hypothetical protein
VPADALHVVLDRIERAIAEDGLAEKHRLDGRAFVKRLRALSYAELVAVVDEIERSWSAPIAYARASFRRSALLGLI